MEDRQMRPSKFTEDQMVGALQQAKAGTAAVQVCRDLGITETTFYRWRAKYDSVALSDSRELRELRYENKKLKEIVADLMLDKQASAGSRGAK
jgi:putative transposase